MKHFHIKEKITKAKIWLKENVFNKQCILGALIAEVIFWSPVWVTALFGLIFDAWWFTATTAIIAFWAGPFTPAIVIQLAFIAFVNRIINKIRRRKNNGRDKESSTTK